MDVAARTLRFDLEHVSQEAVLDMLREQQEIRKVILYHEIADKTGKPHLQGWALFEDERSAVNFQKNRLRLWKQQNKLDAASTSCATVRKTSYFSYCAKDKQCVYSVGVTDEERIANEEKSYKKGKEKESWLDVIALDMEIKYNKRSPPRLSKQEVCEEIIRYYAEQKKPMYQATIKAQTLLVWTRVRGESSYRLLANEFFSD